MVEVTEMKAQTPQPYLPANDEDVAAMLAAIGIASVEDLLTQIPADVRLDRDLDVPDAMSEWELQRHVAALAKKNVGASSRVCFMGGGAYDHFCPAVVDEIASRGEWYTAYTPYQAEASQGTLQAIFEFQTMIAQLTGMDVANASLYEQSTGVVEAVALAMRETRRSSRVVVSSAVHPHTLQTLRTYMAPMAACELAVVEAVAGQTDADAVRSAVDEHTAAIVFQSPNFFGGLEPGEAICEAAHDAGALAIAVVNPISLGVVKRPGDIGVDIVVAEGQSLGTPLGYGGPYLGDLCLSREVRPQDAGTTGEPNGRSKWEAVLRAGLTDSGTAHSPGQGNVQHLQQSGTGGTSGDRVSCDAWAAGAAGEGRAVLSLGSLRG